MRIPKIAAAVFTIILAAGCGGESGKFVVIGHIAPLTGDIKTFGESTKNGFLLAVDEANQTGGVQGQQIRTVIVDDKNDPTEAANAASKLINQDRIAFIIGSVSSKCSIPLSEAAQSSGVVMITPTSTNPKVTVREDGSRKDFVFRACFTDQFQGAAAAKIALEHLGARRAAILYDVGNDYVKGLAEFFRDAFTKGGGEVGVYESYAKDDVDFSALLTKIKAYEPDLLFIPDYYTKVGLVAKQARQVGITARFLGGDGWDSPEMTKIAGDAIEGGCFTNHYAAQDPRPEVQAWVQKYAARWGGKPDALATLAYDATNLLIEALRRSPDLAPQTVRDVLAGMQGFRSVSGSITFDADGNPVKDVAVVEYRDGEQQFLMSIKP
ncbi:MAG: ABC transporter substrate-binding protein [Candidatus Eisenbacteria bacterium]